MSENVKSLGITLQGWNITKNQVSYIVLTLPSRKTIDSIKLTIGHNELTEKSGLVKVDNNLITISAGAMTANKVIINTITFIEPTPEKTLSSIEVTPESLTKSIGDEIKANEISVTLKYSDQSFKENAEYGTDYKVFAPDSAGQEKEIILPYTIPNELVGMTIPCKIKSVADNNKTADLSLKVKSITGLTLAETADVYIDNAEGTKLSAHIEQAEPTNGIEINWEITQGSDIVSIDKTKTESDEDITITGKKIGQATLKATVTAGTTTYTKTCSLDVGYSFDIIIDNNNVIYGNVSGLNDWYTPIKATPLSGGAEETWEKGTFNYQVVLGMNRTEIQQDFMVGCSEFNNGGSDSEIKPFAIPKKVTTIGDRFFRSASKFNQPINGLNYVTSIGAAFISGCEKFNQPINGLENLTNLGENFLIDCKAFNQPITIPAGISTIPYGFLSGCSMFNKKIIIPETITKIERYFLYDCSAFNNGSTGTEDNPLVIPNSVESIGIQSIPGYEVNEARFLCNCTSFNQTIVLPENNKFTKIYSSFLEGCSSLNKPIIFSSNVDTFYTYRSLADLTNFKSVIDLSNIDVSKFTFIWDNVLLAGVPDNNTITFKVKAGTVEGTGMWKEKLQDATLRDGKEGRDPWPSTWTFVEV